ncbi:MAG: D-alanine--D-alanine ligase [Patescibacteria group bacterium]
MTNVALLTGGTTSEREVALKSARNVRAALEENFHVEVFDLPTDLDRFLASRAEFMVAVPVFHGRGGEDGVIQGLLETLGTPYIFSRVEAHAIGLDKAMCKVLAKHNGIKTADWKIVEAGENPVWERPVVVKPVDEGSSVGVTLARDETTYSSLFPSDRRLLVEDLIEGQEFTVAVVDDVHGTMALPVIEIRSKKEFFDYESKYDPALCDELCPAPIDDNLAERLKDIALTAHAMIGARHLSRTDMIVDKQGDIWFLEINTIPGLTSASLTPKAMNAAGLRLEDLLTVWIEDVLKQKTA